MLLDLSAVQVLLSMQLLFRIEKQIRLFVFGRTFGMTFFFEIYRPLKRNKKKHEKTHRKLHQVETKGVQIDVVSQISYDFSQKCP